MLNILLIGFANMAVATLGGAALKRRSSTVDQKVAEGYDYDQIAPQSSNSLLDRLPIPRKKTDPKKLLEAIENLDPAKISQEAIDKGVARKNSSIQNIVQRISASIGITKSSTAAKKTDKPQPPLPSEETLQQQTEGVSQEQQPEDSQEESAEPNELHGDALQSAADMDDHDSVASLEDENEQDPNSQEDSVTEEDHNSSAVQAIDLDHKDEPGTTCEIEIDAEVQVEASEDDESEESAEAESQEEPAAESDESLNEEEHAESPIDNELPATSEEDQKSEPEPEEASLEEDSDQEDQIQEDSIEAEADEIESEEPEQSDSQGDEDSVDGISNEEVESDAANEQKNETQTDAPTEDDSKTESEQPNEIVSVDVTIETSLEEDSDNSAEQTCDTDESVANASENESEIEPAEVIDNQLIEDLFPDSIPSGQYCPLAAKGDYLEQIADIEQTILGLLQDDHTCNPEDVEGSATRLQNANDSWLEFHDTIRDLLNDDKMIVHHEELCVRAEQDLANLKSGVENCQEYVADLLDQNAANVHPDLERQTLTDLREQILSVAAMSHRLRDGLQHVVPESTFPSWRKSSAEFLDHYCEGLDGLSHIMNQFHESEEFAGEPAEIGMVEIQGVQQVNGKHGLAFGDQVLEECNSLIYYSVRHNRDFDRIIRISGNQFIIFFGLAKDLASKYALERIRQKFDVTTFNLNGEPLNVNATCSTIAWDQNLSSGDHFQQLLEAVEKGIGKGGNRVMVFDEERKIQQACQLPNYEPEELTIDIELNVPVGS